MTGASEKQANKYLGKAKWNLQNALNLYYDDGGEPEYTEVQETMEVENLFKKYGSMKFMLFRGKGKQADFR